VLKTFGCFALILACALFTVRWNTVNGKLVGLAFIATGANIAHSVFTVMDKETFVLRPWYPLAATMVLGGLHLMFNANPLLKAGEKKKGN
jgi:hypothetical protein